MSEVIKDIIQKEIVESLGKNIAHGLLKLAPRVGKTKIGIDIIKKEKAVSILWVTPNTQLRDVDIPNEFRRWNAKTYLKKTTIICYNSLINHKGNYDKIILDEYQDLTDKNAKPLLDGTIKYRSILGLSGTHPEHEEKHFLYRLLKLDTLYEISINKAVELGLIADYTINVVQCKLNDVDKNIEAGNKFKRFFTTEQANYNYLTKRIAQAMLLEPEKEMMLNLARMRFIHNSPTKLEVAKYLFDKLTGRKIIFASNIKQSKEFTKHLYNSKTKKTHLEKFLAGKINDLACVNAGGIGFTYKNVDNFIVMQANSDKKGNITQKICRSLVLQENYKATIWMICLLDTQDEIWVQKALKNFKASSINYVNFNNI